MNTKHQQRSAAEEARVQLISSKDYTNQALLAAVASDPTTTAITAYCVPEMREHPLFLQVLAKNPLLAAEHLTLLPQPWPKMLLDAVTKDPHRCVEVILHCLQKELPVDITLARGMAADPYGAFSLLEAHHHLPEGLRDILVDIVATSVRWSYTLLTQQPRYLQKEALVLSVLKAPHPLALETDRRRVLRLLAEAGLPVPSAARGAMVETIL